MGALEAHDVRTRIAGRATFIDFHLVVPGSMTVSEPRGLCDRIEDALREEIADAMISIHVEPEEKAKHPEPFVSSDRFTALSAQRLQSILDRIMHAWSLIKLVPEQRLSVPRSSVEAELLQNADLTDNELLVIGLKYLHRVDGPGGRKRDNDDKDNATNGVCSNDDFWSRWQTFAEASEAEAKFPFS
jgi:hypothetical protein